MRNFTHLPERDKELKKIYWSLYDQHKKEMSYGEIIKMAIQHPSPQYYVSYSETVRVINKKEKGAYKPKKRDTKEKLWADIYDKYTKQKYNGKSKKEIVEKILSEEAPQFYLTPDYAYMIIYGK